MVKKMKLRFLNKHTSSSSHSSHSSSSSSSWPWPWPSSHHQNRETISSKACFTVSKPKRIDEPPLDKFSSCSSFSSSSHAMDNPLEPEVIENVIKGLKPSKRLIFEQRGESNSILENAIKKEIEEEEDEEAHKEEEEEEGQEEEEEEEEEGFMLLALESKDPYTDFKKSMEKMVETHELHHDWRSLEKLLFWFLKVNVKTSHKYIFTAFVDLLLSLPVELSKNLLEDSPSSPISFNTSCSYSDETSSMLPGNSICEIKSVGCCLSSLFEMDVKINDNLDYVSSY